MKNIFLLVGFLVACDGNRQTHQKSEEQVFAKLLFPSKTQTKRSAYLRDSIAFAFPVKNVGANPLRIVDVQTSCGCTVSKYDSVVMPSDSAEIRFVMEILPKDSVKTVHATIISNTSEKYHLLTMSFVRTVPPPADLK